MVEGSAISALITEIAKDVIAVLIPAAAAIGAELLRRKLGTEKMLTLQNELATKQSLGIMAVRYIEQAYKERHGQDKFDLAADWLASKARQSGLKITPDEIKALIESSIKILKESCGLEQKELTGPEGRL